jgi:pimeloyl-ACP methyl ester carboxylesterase
MAQAKLRPVTLAGTPAAAQPWQPRLQLFELVAGSANRKQPVLYIHGATFPAENSIFFKLGGASWADALNIAGFSVWGLDFADFGRSERYPEMSADAPPAGEPLGRVPDAVKQIERAVRAIVAETGAAKVSIIAHSWGTMAAGRFAGDHPELVDRLVFFGPIVRREVLKGVPPLGTWRFLTVEAQKKRFIEDVPQGESGALAESDFPAWSALYLESDPTSLSRTPPVRADAEWPRRRHHGRLVGCARLRAGPRQGASPDRAWRMGQPLQGRRCRMAEAGADWRGASSRRKNREGNPPHASRERQDSTLYGHDPVP